MTSIMQIRHTVVFSLKLLKGSPEEQNFLSAAHGLSSIEGVEKFEVLRQISPKNSFDWGISMEFASLEDYQRYNNHPDHLAFIENHWMKCVSDFLEIDYQL